MEKELSGCRVVVNENLSTLKKNGLNPLLSAENIRLNPKNRATVKMIFRQPYRSITVDAHDRKNTCFPIVVTKAISLDHDGGAIYVAK